nr:SHOCT domain-containing protein [uncultured Acetatifactor sp.]
MRDDVKELLEKYEISSFGNKKNIEKAEEKLQVGETVTLVLPTNAVLYTVNTGKKKKLPGVFLLTDKRILFCYKAGVSEAVDTISLSEVKSVDYSGNGISGGHIIIHALTKSLDILVTYKKKVMQEMVDTINKAVFEYGHYVQTPESNDNILQIEKLHELYEKGIVTREEFEEKKRQLLGL